MPQEKLPRNRWLKIPVVPEWWWVIWLIAKRHGYRQKDIWRFLLHTLKTTYPDDWKTVVTTSKLQGRESEIDE